jgi:hypothetical protein
MMVDLLDVDPGLLTRYLGRGGARDFLAFHQESNAATSRACAPAGGVAPRLVAS